MSAGTPRPTSSAAALGAAEFAAAMEALGPWGPQPRIAVAVSGGSDSLGLALLAHGWAAARGGALLSLIVDHGLRPESASEAEQVRHWLHARGMDAAVLRAPAAADRDGGSVQERARRLRYRLLLERCVDLGIAHLLLAHHRDDQAETVLMRLVRGSGLRGLAGIAPSALAPGSAGRVRLLRPLLDVPKERLRATLEAAGQGWVEDPSNRDLRHERVRWRKLMPLLKAGGVEPDRLASAAAQLAEERAALDRSVAAWLATASPSRFGHVTADLGGYGALAPAIADAALARLLGSVGGGGYPPRRESLSALAESLRGSEVLELARTLAGCVVTRTGARLTVTREPQAVREVSQARPGLLLWDGRFELRLDGPADRLAGIRVAALGAAGLAELRNALRAKGMRLPAAPARQLQTLPALWHGGRLVEVPHLPVYGKQFAAGVAWAPRQPLTG